jgi:hypothetical protein
MLRNIIVVDSSLVIIVGKVITIASSSKTILADYISLQCSRCSSKMSCLIKWFRHVTSYMRTQYPRQGLDPAIKLFFIKWYETTCFVTSSLNRIFLYTSYPNVFTLMFLLNFSNLLIALRHWKLNIIEIHLWYCFTIGECFYAHSILLVFVYDIDDAFFCLSSCEELPFCSFNLFM